MREEILQRYLNGRITRRQALLALAALGITAPAAASLLATVEPAAGMPRQMADPQVLSTERVGQLTGSIDPQDWPLLTNTSEFAHSPTVSPAVPARGWAVDGVDLGANVEHNNRLYIFFGDVATGHRKLNTDVIAWSDDLTVLHHGGHRAATGSWEFFLPNDHQGADPNKGQRDWRFCEKCCGLFWAQDGGTAGTKCPYDLAEHRPAGWMFFLPNDQQGGDEHTGQLGWRYCGNCHGLFWAPQGNPAGVCPAGGKHVPIGWIFSLPNDKQGANGQTGQPHWRFCGACESLYFDGYPAKGVCPAAPGGGIRLNAVLKQDDGYFFPLTAGDPVFETTSLETPGGLFSHNSRIYAFVNISEFRYSEQYREAEPALGTYLISSDVPDEPKEYRTEFLVSPRIGACRAKDDAVVVSHDPRGYGFVLPHEPSTTDTNGDWHFCTECASMFQPANGSNGKCFGPTGTHNPAGFTFALPLGTVDSEQNQASWYACRNCRTLFWNGRPGDTGSCPSGGSHVADGPQLSMPHRSLLDDPTHQRRWRFCGKCAVMFFDPADDNVCPADRGKHEAAGLEFWLPHNIEPVPADSQNSWRFCGKCAGLFWERAPGVCPKDGAHQAGAGGQFTGYDFALPHDISAGPLQQDNWRFCGRCAMLFWAGTKGVCPQGPGGHQAGAGPDATGYNFVLAHNPGADARSQDGWRFCQRCYSMVYTWQPDRFAGLSPWKIESNAEHPYLPPSPTGLSLLMLGFGYDDPCGFRLAWMPLTLDRTPELTSLRYFTGWPQTADGQATWSARPEDAINILEWPSKQYTSIALTWLPGPRKWMFLYSDATNKLGDAAREGAVQARFADRPWDLKDAPATAIFNPKTSNAYGVYMNDASNDIARRVPPDGDDHKAWAYGAYPIVRHTKWDEQKRELDLYYLLSLSSPYQVQLMNTRLHIP